MCWGGNAGPEKKPPSPAILPPLAAWGSPAPEGGVGVAEADGGSGGCGDTAGARVDDGEHCALKVPGEGWVLACRLAHLRRRRGANGVRERRIKEKREKMRRRKIRDRAPALLVFTKGCIALPSCY